MGKDDKRKNGRARKDAAIKINQRSFETFMADWEAANETAE